MDEDYYFKIDEDELSEDRVFVLIIYDIISNKSRNKFSKLLFLKTLQNGQWVAVDSAEVIHGLFSMKGPVDSVMMVTLYMDDEGIMPLVLEDGKIEDV